MLFGVDVIDVSERWQGVYSSAAGSEFLLAEPIGGVHTARRRSDLDGGSADATFLELPAIPASDGNEKQRELLGFPYPCPLCGVVTARARSGLPRAEVLPLGAETE